VQRPIRECRVHRSAARLKLADSTFREPPRPCQCAITVTHELPTNNRRSSVNSPLLIDDVVTLPRIIVVVVSGPVRGYHQPRGRFWSGTPSTPRSRFTPTVPPSVALQLTCDRPAIRKNRRRRRRYYNIRDSRVHTAAPSPYRIRAESFADTAVRIVLQTTTDFHHARHIGRHSRRRIV